MKFTQSEIDYLLEQIQNALEYEYDMLQVLQPEKNWSMIEIKDYQNYSYEALCFTIEQRIEKITMYKSILTKITGVNYE